jgi:hypothetical protein
MPAKSTKVNGNARAAKAQRGCLRKAPKPTATPAPRRRNADACEKKKTQRADAIKNPTPRKRKTKP